MDNAKKKILMFKPTLQQQVTMLMRYSDKCNVKATDCFTDILAIPAAMIVLNPEHLSLQEMEQMNEIFKYDYETVIVFTCHFTPKLFGVLGNDKECMFGDNMKYQVVTDLEKIDVEI